jgi:hypothetical protein
MMAITVILLPVVRESGAAGILTDRLSSSQLRTWQSIQCIVFAQDKAGRLLHPTLRNLWQQAEASGHTIYIEMPEPKGPSQYTSGKFSVEETTSGDQPRAGVIRLYLQVIDRTSTSGQCRRWKNGFLPFEKLANKTLRYAEVLGHELVHALLTLTNPDYSRLATDLGRENRELQLNCRSRNGQPFDEETLRRLKRIQSFEEELERSPEEVEVIVWRELLAGQRREASASIGSETGWAAMLVDSSRAN